MLLRRCRQGTVGTEFSFPVSSNFLLEVGLLLSVRDRPEAKVCWLCSAAKMIGTPFCRILLTLRLLPVSSVVTLSNSLNVYAMK